VDLFVSALLSLCSASGLSEVAVIVEGVGELISAFVVFGVDRTSTAVGAFGSI
jgi:hypothetical protein